MSRRRKALLVAGGPLLGPGLTEGTLSLVNMDLPCMANLRGSPWR